MLGIGLGPSSCDPLDLERCLGEEERSYYSRESAYSCTSFFADEKVKIQRKEATYSRSHSSQFQLIPVVL